MDRVKIWMAKYEARCGEASGIPFATKINAASIYVLSDKVMKFSISQICVLSHQLSTIGRNDVGAKRFG